MVNIRRKNLRWADIEMNEVKLDKLVMHFTQSNKAEGKSPKTIGWYSEMLDSFIKYLESQDDRAVLSDLNIENVREFVVYEQERGMSAYTVQGKVRALKAFSSWLFREGYTPDNLLCNIKLPKAPTILIEPLVTEEIDRLINYQNPLNAIGCRDIAILLLMIDTGIRLSEICRLQLEDTRIEEGYLKVMGKGNKERVVPFGATVQKMLWRYAIHFRPENIAYADNSLFLTLDGQSLKPNAVKLMINRWGKKAGVPRLHAHLCRHTFATNFLVYNCGDVFRLQQILVHTSLEMVRRYVHYVSAQDLMNGKTLSPIDRMGGKKLRGYKIDQILNKTNDNLRRNRYG